MTRKQGGVVMHHSPAHTIREMQGILDLVAEAAVLKVPLHDFIYHAFGTQDEPGALTLLRKRVKEAKGR